MAFSHSRALSLPEHFYTRDTNTNQPQTPEPLKEEDDVQQPPSPPRPKFKLKRRVASNLNAPTQQFLASVAAADVPIPSIEEPDVTSANHSASNMIHPAPRSILDLDGGTNIRGRRFALPRTPAPGSAPSLSPTRYPEWAYGSNASSGESTPEGESSRPSTAVSTQTSASLFSRCSVNSDDFRCPDMWASDTALSRQPTFDLSNDSIGSTIRPRSKSRRAQWSRPLSDHVWSIYLMYLQDPKVTPIRFGKSGIPPHGVCQRVAREAKRSWRGAKSLSKLEAAKSRTTGSLTPTAEPTSTFMSWPHTCAATRAHLRDLCKASAASSGLRPSGHIVHSPTPFGKLATRLRNRRTPTPSRFSKDMSLSLMMSTSESMQPSGPLAQLTQATPPPIVESDMNNPSAPGPGPSRLASPFMARSYGPSSTGATGAALALGHQRQAQTMGAQYNLQPPARVSRNRSNTHTQKRRSRQSSLEPRRTKRPSLGSDLWARPSTPPSRPQPLETVETEFSSTKNTHRDELFVPRTNLSEMFSQSISRPQPRKLFSTQTLAGFPELPSQLGPPFSTSKTSFSFPSRLVKAEQQDKDSGLKPFATIQQSGESSNPRTRNLTGRLAYIDQRLKEFRRRDGDERRSESP